MADVANDRLLLRDSELGWPLEELWVGGDLLGHRSGLEAGAVVLVLDLPPEELPWLAMHPAAEWVGAQLRLGKRPFLWSYRPILWPVWNQETMHGPQSPRPMSTDRPAFRTFRIQGGSAVRPRSKWVPLVGPSTTTSSAWTSLSMRSRRRATSGWVA